MEGPHDAIAAPLGEADRTHQDEEFIAAANAHNEGVQKYLDGQQVRRETLDLIISV
jgi:hypothetical protein